MNVQRKKLHQLFFPLFFETLFMMLAVGAYAAMALDECVRAVLMYARWRRGNWQRFRLVSEK